MIDATKFVMDHEAERIIAGTYEKERTATEISELYGIPISNCYRKINELKKAGLLEITGYRLSKRGKKINLYQANLKDAYVFYENGKMKVRFQVILEMTRDFMSRFQSVSELAKLEQNKENI